MMEGRAVREIDLVVIAVLGGMATPAWRMGLPLCDGR